MSNVVKGKRRLETKCKGEACLGKGEKFKGNKEAKHGHGKCLSVWKKKMQESNNEKSAYLISFDQFSVGAKWDNTAGF